LKKKEAPPTASRAMCNVIIPNAPDVTSKLAGTTGASETGLRVEGELVELSPKSTEGSAEGNAEGNVEGIIEGCSDGDSEGKSEASTEGNNVGNSEKNTEGSSEGSAEGNTEGSIEGNTEGWIEGIIEGSRDGDTDGTTEATGRVCSVHVHLATGKTVIPPALAKAPLDGSRSIEYIKMGESVSSGKKRSSAVPASHGKVSTSNS
jgi:hypothetical protein